MRFVDRQDAGKRLAEALRNYEGAGAIIYALPRGGVVLGFEVARALKAPLDLVITRKIGHPQNPEYAVCAVAENGEFICDEAEKSSLDPVWLKKAVEHEQQEALRRRKIYLHDAKRVSSRGKTAILVDDGIATGLTMRAAVQLIRKEKPKTLVIAVPVSPHDVILALRKEADEVVVLEDTQNYLGAVGSYYEDFQQVSDEDVISLLRKI